MIAIIYSAQQNLPLSLPLGKASQAATFLRRPHNRLRKPKSQRGGNKTLYGGLTTHYGKHKTDYGAAKHQAIDLKLVTLDSASITES